ncbi:metallophosphoesterase [Roseovarius sp. M141]|uniref:metallophosphoesterase n=1 Tax=Roseovarius sp. M141 TaxID=2583806 RepID=UPI0020CF6DB7|nr:metallophosphoesterase [Roseovarius sp. M141]MCQ0090497.1 serine/threonine protein phosphatase [Roseovarius sp. M141]
MRSLRGLLSGRLSKTGIAGGFSALPRPDIPTCIVGDLHGRMDLLERMLDAISARADAGPYRVIFVGDLIDRGPQSAEILSHLAALCAAAPDRVICLMGNHERMMLDFIDDPVRCGPRWLANGGNETLISFGLSPWARRDGINAAERLKVLAAGLVAAMPGEGAHWLANLPLSWCEGALAVTHAGADPARGIADQTAETLLWGHPAFSRQPRRDGLWVAHGHTIVEKAASRSGRIAVDTGAWRTGRLSAAWLSKDGLDFIEVTSV